MVPLVSRLVRVTSVVLYFHERNVGFQGYRGRVEWDAGQAISGAGYAGADTYFTGAEGGG